LLSKSFAELQSIRDSTHGFSDPCCVQFDE
jgi:hypothetical protein